jgi:hypothetical protein
VPAGLFYRLLGDVDGNRGVYQPDLNMVVALGQSGANLPADANGDGTVDAMDRRLVLAARRHRLASGLFLGLKP